LCLDGPEQDLARVWEAISLDDDVRSVHENKYDDRGFNARRDGNACAVKESLLLQSLCNQTVVLLVQQVLSAAV
jgi:hypothetical protein